MGTNLDEQLIDLVVLKAHLEGMKRGTDEVNALSVRLVPPRDCVLSRQAAPATSLMKRLILDDDFRAFMRQAGETPSGEDVTPFSSLISDAIENSEIKRAKNTQFVFDDHLLESAKVPLYWDVNIRELLRALEVLRPRDSGFPLGTGVYSDGSLRLDILLELCGVMPACPGNQRELDLTLHALNERRAELLLGLDDNSVLVSVCADSSWKTLTLAFVRRFEIEHQSLWAYLDVEQLLGKPGIDVETSPAVVISELITAPKGQALGLQLAAELGWQPRDDERSISTDILARLALTVLNLKLDPMSSQRGSSIGGFDFSGRDTWGVSYADIPRLFRRSLLQSGAARTDAMAWLISRLMRSTMEARFQVREVPPELHCYGSSSWVYFSAAVSVAEAVSPGTVRHRTYKGLMAEFVTLSLTGTPEQLALIATARLVPALEWAVASGLVVEKSDGYSTEDFDEAVLALDHYETVRQQAVRHLASQPPLRWKYDSDELFETAFDLYLTTIQQAYTLIVKSLLAQLPIADRLAIEYGEVCLLALSKLTMEPAYFGIQPEMQARQGFIVKALYGSQARFYEVFPAAYRICVREDLRELPLGGERYIVKTGRTFARYVAETELALDWDAYAGGTPVQTGVLSRVIVRQVGHALPAVPERHRNVATIPRTLSSERSAELGLAVVQHLFYVDQHALRKKCRSQDGREVERVASEVLEDFGKVIVPFWGAVDDLSSDDPGTIAWGVFGLFCDIAMFALPVGKFISATARLSGQAGRTTVRAVMPEFKSLTKQLLSEALGQLNPVDGIPELLIAGAGGVLKLGRKSVSTIDVGLKQLRSLSGNAAPATFKNGIPFADPLQWKSMRAGDELRRLDGVDNVVVRTVSHARTPLYRLVGPVTGDVYGVRYADLGRGELVRVPNLERYEVAFEHQQIAELSRRANGLYDGPGQKTYVFLGESRVESGWFEVRSRPAHGGGSAFHVVNPRNEASLRYPILRKGSHWSLEPSGGLQGGGHLLESFGLTSADQTTLFEISKRIWPAGTLNQLRRFLSPWKFPADSSMSKCTQLLIWMEQKGEIAPWVKGFDFQLEKTAGDALTPATQVNRAQERQLTKQARERQIQIYEDAEIMLLARYREPLDGQGSPEALAEELRARNEVIGWYTQDENAFNKLLRGQDYVSPAGPDQFVELFDALAHSPASGAAVVYRGGSGTRSTSGKLFREGKLRPGDTVLSTDFTSFTENPYVAGRFANPEAAGSELSSSPRFDDTSVVFAVQDPQNAKSVMLVSITESECEALYAPGNYFRIDKVQLVTVPEGEFVQVNLTDLGRAKPDGPVFNFRTGEVFDLDSYIDAMKVNRVGAAVGPSVRGFFGE